MFNPYTHLKSKCKKDFDDSIHLAYLTNVMLSMFEYKNLPETIPAWVLETILISEGTAGITEIDGKLYTGTGGFCGNVINFLPVEYQITNTGVGSKRGKIGESFAVGYNNSILSPDFSIMQTASILAEIDVSERCNVLFSRFLRIPRVSDTKEKTAIENAVKSISEGKFEAVISKNILDDILSGENPNEKFIDLVDIKEIDKLQYLNQYRDNIIKRFFQIYGQGMQTTSKLAQQTTDELHGNDAISLIIPFDKLKCRQKMCEDVNKIFGTDVSVDFSLCWKDSVDEMKKLYSTGETDLTPTGNGDDGSGDQNNNSS